MPQLERMTAEAAQDEGLRCAFCEREPADGSDLIAAGDVVICDECVAGCSDLLRAPASDTKRAAPAIEDDGAEDRPAERPPKQTFFRLLNEADVAYLITMDDLIDLMELTLARFSAGEIVQPLRTVMATTERDFFAVAPAYVPARVREAAILGARIATEFGGNATLDLPTHLATTLLFSGETGALLAVLGGRYLTAARTAAVSAVSARLLARDDAGRVAIIGSGAQARSHLHALERVFELSSVRVWSPTPEHQDLFIEEEQSATSARLDGADSAEQAVHDADLIVLATSASEPVVQQEWIKAGAHVMSVGAGRPDQREMDPALIQRARVFVDSRAAALAESGDIVLGIREQRFSASVIAGELGEVVAKSVEGRRSPREVTLFKSMGPAFEEAAAADYVYRRALAQEAGIELEI